MQTLQHSWKSALVFSVALLMTAAAIAQGEKEAGTDKVGDVVEELGIAAQLAAYGRGELNDLTGLKDFKSADALVAAGAITLRAYKGTAGQLAPADIQVTEDGKPVTDPQAQPSLEAEAEALFDEARLLATDKAAIESAIKQAKLVTTRGAIGGPRMISRTVKSGKTHALHIEFKPNSTAQVTMKGTGKVQFEVIGDGGKVLWHSTGSWGTYRWHTAKAGVRDITVKVINAAGPAVAYTVVTN